MSYGQGTEAARGFAEGRQFATEALAGSEADETLLRRYRQAREFAQFEGETEEEQGYFRGYMSGLEQGTFGS